MFYRFSPDFLKKILTKKFTSIRRIKEIFYVNNFYEKYKKIKIVDYGRGLINRPLALSKNDMRAVIFARVFSQEQGGD